MKTKVLHIILLLSLSLSGLSQTKSQLISVGDDSFEDGDYYGAGTYYNRAYQLDSNDLSLSYKYAQALRLQNNYTKAEQVYSRIYKKDGGREFPKAVFWLASMQKINGKYLESYKTWKHVKTLYRKSSSYENKKAKQEIRGSAFARREQKYRSEAKVENIGEGVNTVASEFNPIVQNNTLYFSSLRAKNVGANGEILDENYRVKLYEAMLKDSSWMTEDDLPAVINTIQNHNANSCFNHDGTKFYFSRCSDKNVCKIMVSRYENDKWSAPKSVSFNSEFSSSTQPMSCQLKGEEYLFFVSDRKSGYGKLDIWFVKRTGETKFTTPENAGKYVNSIDNEITPFYDSENSLLYFSSDWHAGLGGFDIFQSKGRPDKLKRPKNLGAPINSQWNDMYYFRDTVSEINYFASNREGSMTDKNATCCNDIYSVTFPREIPPKEIEILTIEDLNKYLPVTLYFHNDRPNPRTIKTTTELNYLTTYEDYINRIPTYRKEYSSGLSGLKEEEAILDIDDFFKDYVEKGVKDLAFFTELLFLELEKGTEIELTVKGFASPLAKTDYNVNLTSRRIYSLKNYLNEFENGKFKQFIASGKLRFKEVPFGEYTANKLVSDNLNDKKNSVYSRAAALERKIEIQSVNLLNKSETAPRISFDKESKDFGKVKNGTPIEVEFTIFNEGKAPLIISEIEGSCSCTVVETDKSPLAPGTSRMVKANINTEQLFGKTTKTITVKSNAIPASKDFIVTFEIIENK